MSNRPILLKRLPDRITESGNMFKMGLFQCPYCPNRFETYVAAVTRKTQFTKSCGCYQKKRASEAKTTHGLSKTNLHKVWKSIKHRCYNKKAWAYKWYGARGIIICKEWHDNFKAFYDYVSQLPGFGESGLSLDRIDNNGNYEPGNLRFATHKQQMNNTRITNQ